MAHSQEIERLFGAVGTFEHGATFFEESGGLEVAALFERLLGVVEFIVVVVAFEHTLVFAAGANQQRNQGEEDVFSSIHLNRCGIEHAKLRK